MVINIEEVKNKTFKPHSKIVAVEFDEGIRYYVVSNHIAYMKQTQQLDRRPCRYLGKTDSLGKLNLKNI